MHTTHTSDKRYVLIQLTTFSIYWMYGNSFGQTVYCASVDCRMCVCLYLLQIKAPGRNCSASAALVDFTTTHHQQKKTVRKSVFMQIVSRWPGCKEHASHFAASTLIRLLISCNYELTVWWWRLCSTCVICCIIRNYATLKLRPREK